MHAIEKPFDVRKLHRRRHRLQQLEDGREQQHLQLVRPRPLGGLRLHLCGHLSQQPLRRLACLVRRHHTRARLGGRRRSISLDLEARLELGAYRRPCLLAEVGSCLAHEVEKRLGGNLGEPTVLPLVEATHEEGNELIEQILERFVGGAKGSLEKGEHAKPRVVHPIELRGRERVVAVGRHRVEHLERQLSVGAHAKLAAQRAAHVQLQGKHLSERFQRRGAHS
mmetsp:Transcript_10832/g.23590  ORF Transcript_10832/g.23590 Transcript_10832/m.23590 type:complete len:224 (+) Transcript_10832:214-885(+)